MRLLTILTLCAATLAGAQTLPTTITVKDITYTGVAYRSHDAAKVKITHDEGMASLDLADLPPDIQTALSFDPAAASEIRQAETAKAAAAQRAIDAKAQAKQQRLGQLDDARDASLSDAAAERLRKSIAQAEAKLRAIQKEYEASLGKLVAQGTRTYTFDDGSSVTASKDPADSARYHTPENKARREKMESLQTFIADAEAQLQESSKK
jgi:hypothetical protein